jgi:hypothetical protein
LNFVNPVNQPFMTLVHVAPLLTEELFQHIWLFRLFTQTGLATVEGEPVQIIHPGYLNTHAGPDFTAARIRIGNKIWAGNVELHLRTSDWFKHGHQHNLQYQNVVLHVVFEHDVHVPGLWHIPCLELQQFIPKVLLHRYAYLKHAATFVPCANSAAKVPVLVWESWKERLLAERLERKSAVMQEWLQKNKYDWEEVCYWALARSFGSPANGELFLQLARSLPYHLLLRHRHDRMQLEALLFGQAGMLEGAFEDDYALTLQREYAFFRHKYQLQPLPGQLWKWLRMRPASFPTIRIAAFAALLHQHTHLFSQLIAFRELPLLEQWLDIPLTGYWETHYRFGVPVAQTRRPGRMAMHNILINTVLPLLYLYGSERDSSDHLETAVRLMGELPPEDNVVIRGWEDSGVTANNAGDTQALLELKQLYCEEKRCLQCAIGARLLRQGIV